MRPVGIAAAERSATRVDSRCGRVFVARRGLDNTRLYLKFVPTVANKK